MLHFSCVWSFSESSSRGTALCKHWAEPLGFWRHFSASLRTFHYFDMTHTELGGQTHGPLSWYWSVACEQIIIAISKTVFQCYLLLCCTSVNPQIVNNAMWWQAQTLDLFARSHFYLGSYKRQGLAWTTEATTGVGSISFDLGFSQKISPLGFIWNWLNIVSGQTWYASTPLSSFE